MPDGSTEVLSHHLIDSCSVTSNEDALPGEGTETVEPVLPQHHRSRRVDGGPFRAHDPCSSQTV